MHWKTKVRICFAVFFIGFLNFTVYWFVALAIGGDAVNGKVVDGHYYLANHGHLTEVSRETFNYSLIHTRSIFVTHPLAFIALIVGAQIQRKHKGK